jgi:hypothetical protein
MGVRSTRKLDVPHEDGEWIKVRLLSNAQQRELKAKGAEERRLAGEEKDEARGWAYLDAVCQLVIIDWSYRDEETGEVVPVNEENIRDLDAKTAKWVFSVVMDKETDEGKEDA